MPRYVEFLLTLKLLLNGQIENNIIFYNNIN
jgi:hypothetical protein